MIMQSSPFMSPPLKRVSALHKWSELQDLWKSMMIKETKYAKNTNYFPQHPDIEPQMRAILLDWLIEVCEVYTLQRETFYLCVDYFDRYLSLTNNVRKTQLQLIGITTLFIAAKLEEIYPPKLTEFAYVTDGACTEEEIVKQETILLHELQWKLAPITSNSWLNVYLQAAHLSLSKHAEQTFILPQYSQNSFVHVAQLIDLCVLDAESLQFSSGILAASALYHFSSCKLATHVSGFDYQDLAKCIHWMAPFALTVRDNGLQSIKKFPKVHPSDYHNIQTHANELYALKAVEERRMQCSVKAVCTSPTEIAGIITPPKSGQKNVVVLQSQENHMVFE